MWQKEFPILEFDPDKDAFLRPEKLFQAAAIAEKCVLCFFAEAIENILAKYPYRIVTKLKYDPLEMPVYELDYKGEKIVLIQACTGAPFAAAQIEDLTVLGCKKFIACGSCGILEQGIAAGHLIIPVAAVRDEGTSYHYLAPSREIIADQSMTQLLAQTLTESDVPYIKAKTWTTDAPYRETGAKIQQRRKEGCVTVEMEASAYMAAARYNNVEFGQILYAGDNLSGNGWEHRGYDSMWEIREYVLTLVLDACIKLQ